MKQVSKTSQRLERLSPEIMDVWVERTLKEVKAANLQETLALRNSLPIYLSQLVEALSITIDRTDARKLSDLSDSTRIGKKHGRERATASEYTMDQMILEYHILRQVICAIMEKEEILTPVEREVIVCSIEQAVNDAATQFSDTSRDFQDNVTHILAHDLRNPLTTLKTSAQMLAKQLTERGHLDKLSRIIKGADRIDEMIQQLLNESRINANEKKLEFKECDLDWLVRDISYELNISANDRFLVQSSGKCIGSWNENCLRRIVENLASNAIKYGEEGTPISIIVSQDETTAFLKLHNQGNPIPKEQQLALFQKFTRLTSAERKIGWGIGLNVVKSMVEKHMGSIEVQSETGEGTTFIIKLPKLPKDRLRPDA
ncbi:MAG TPA: HAMP domain-containing sensor histidine kinase [Bacteriovoracaceae bacterium]|nr:HAMP domain-containing sensor histidine kinase [Bacteriovoracaceae bacterium]